MARQALRIGYVPEHFFAPIQLAFEHYGLADHAIKVPFPAGTGKMIEALAANEIDAGIGLTEAWIAGMARSYQSASATSKQSKHDWQPYRLVSSYVDSPLRWALSIGANRTEINSVADLRGKKVGVSRIGSGSHIMSTVLADQQGWMGDTFEIVVCGVFKELRDAVNSGKADFFMWEHFTTKKYYDDGSLKHVGEIPTPWNGWHIVAKNQEAEDRIRAVMLPALDKGLERFKADREEVIQFIITQLDYSREDAEEWYKEVRYPGSFAHVNHKGVQAAVDSLRKVGIIESSELVPASFVGDR